MKKIVNIGINTIEVLYGFVGCVVYPYIKLFVTYHWNYQKIIVLSSLIWIASIILFSIFNKLRTESVLYKILAFAFVKYSIGFVMAMILLFIISVAKNIPGYYFYYVCPLPFCVWTDAAWVWSGIKLILLGVFSLWSVIITSQVISRINIKKCKKKDKKDIK